MEKVSIVIPVFNVEKYLVDCLNSIFCQDYPCIEVIAINDGSTDNSLKILLDYQARYPNFQIINSSNQGLSIARNFGIENSSGEFIMFVDSDDVILPTTISTSMRYFKKFSVDIVLFSGNAFADGSPDYLANQMNYNRPSQLVGKVFPTQLLFCEFVKSKNYIVSSCLFIARRKYIGELTFKSNIYHEDNLFTTKLLLSEGKHSAICLSEQFYQRRVRPNSTMTIDRNMKHIEGYITVAEDLIAFNSKEAIYYSSLNKFIQQMIMNSIHSSILVFKFRLPVELYINNIKLFFRTKVNFYWIKVLLFVVFPHFFLIRNYMSRFFR